MRGIHAYRNIYACEVDAKNISRVAAGTNGQEGTTMFTLVPRLKIA